eukprot:1158457-Pelagomonas_calceolata.AAC.1
MELQGVQGEGSLHAILERAEWSERIKRWSIQGAKASSIPPLALAFPLFGPAPSAATLRRRKPQVGFFAAWCGNPCFFTLDQLAQLKTHLIPERALTSRLVCSGGPSVAVGTARPLEPQCVCTAIHSGPTQAESKRLTHCHLVSHFTALTAIARADRAVNFRVPCLPCCAFCSVMLLSL